MSRIIAGAASGIPLASVRGSDTRPTTDRTKEALFSWLQSRDWCEDTVVLDLYAGSGALGLEALSRGARSATLVERDRTALEVCRRNTDAVNRALGRRAGTALGQSVERFLARRTEADLILADPPYPLDGPELDGVLVSAAASLTPGGLLVLERSARSAPPTRPEGLEEVDVRTYGETALYFWQDVR